MHLPPSRPPAATIGFTLIELLITMAIILTLFAMLMPLLALAQRESKKSGTRTTMVKTDIAMRLFRNEFGSFPYQRSYAGGATWTNRLYYQLGTDIAAGDLANVIADADAAATRYAYDISTDIRGALALNLGSRPANLMASRMARERVRLAILAGNASVAHVVAPFAPVLATPLSDGRAGMAKDYLRGELPARHVLGDAILDAWGRPLIYVCQVVEGMHSAPVIWNDQQMAFFKAQSVGLHTAGRRSLAPVDRLTGAALVAAPPDLPDPARLRHSDRRTYAAWQLEAEPELWSAGGDGLADWMRDAAANHDNVSLLPYDKDIP